MAWTGQLGLVAVLAASGNPSQRTHNVKITFRAINFYFLKMNECK